MNKKLLLFSDLHLDHYRHFSTMTKYGNSRLLSQVLVIKKIKKIAKEEKPEAIIFLGDLFNGQGASINKQLYLVGYSLVEELQEVAPLYLIVGNHDLYGNSHILSPMSSLHNAQVIDEPIVVNLLGMRMAMVPYALSIPKEGDILLGHLDIDGAKTGAGFELAGTIHRKELDHFKKAILGHFHSYQTIEPNITYCGAVMPNDFGDIDEEHGIMLLHDDLTLERRIINSPSFYKVTISTQEDIEKFLKNKSDDNYYRVTVTDRKLELPQFDHKVEIEWDVVEEVKGRLEYAIDDSLEKILDTYIDNCKTKADKEEAKKVLQEVMLEC